jgi:hypothetical protein
LFMMAWYWEFSGASMCPVFPESRYLDIAIFVYTQVHRKVKPLITTLSSTRFVQITKSNQDLV